MENKKGGIKMTRFYIDGLNRVDRIYFSADGKNFNSKDSVQLNAYSANEFDAEPDEYVVFYSDLLDPDEVIGEITYRESDYHTIITVDGIEYAIDDDNIHLVKDVFCEKEVN
jgi:hypothetical protein